MLVTPQTIMQLPSGPVQVNSTQPILSGIPQVATANHMYTQAQVATSPGYTLIPAGDFALNSLNSPLFYYANNVPSTNAHPMALATNAQVATIASPMNNISRADKLEVCRDFQRGNCTRGENECRYAHPFDRTMIDPTDNKVTVCMDCIKGRCIRDKCKYFHPPVHLQAKVRACQHQVAAYMPTVQANTHTLTTTQPGMVANNSMTNALGQPPQKRHAVEPKVMSGSPSIGASITPSPTGTPTLYSYGIPMHQHAATPAHAHAYYQAPFFSIYNGASAAGMQSAQSALTTLPTANGQANVSNATALAILNGQSQIMLK